MSEADKDVDFNTERARALANVLAQAELAYTQSMGLYRAYIDEMVKIHGSHRALSRWIKRTGVGVSTVLKRDNFASVRELARAIASFPLPSQPDETTKV